MINLLVYKPTGLLTGQFNNLLVFKPTSLKNLPAAKPGGREVGPKNKYSF